MDRRSEGMFEFVTEFLSHSSPPGMHVVDDVPVQMTGMLPRNASYSCLLVRDSGEDFWGVSGEAACQVRGRGGGTQPVEFTQIECEAVGCCHWKQDTDDGKGACWSSLGTDRCAERGLGHLNPLDSASSHASASQYSYGPYTYGSYVSFSPAHVQFVEEGEQGPDPAVEQAALVSCSSLSRNFRGGEEALDLVLVREPEQTQVPTAGPIPKLKMMALIESVEGMVRSEDGEWVSVGWRLPVGAALLQSNSSAGGSWEMPAILVQGSGFVSEEEEAYYQDMRASIGLGPFAFSRGYSCALCVLAAAASEGGEAFCLASADIQARVYTSNKLVCYLPPAFPLLETFPPGADPRLRVSIIRTNLPVDVKDGSSYLASGSGGGWDEAHSNRSVTVAAGVGDVTIAVVGYVDSIFPRILPAQGGVTVTVTGRNMSTQAQSDFTEYFCLSQSVSSATLYKGLSTHDTSVMLRDAPGDWSSLAMSPLLEQGQLVLQISSELMAVTAVSVESTDGTTITLQVRRRLFTTDSSAEEEGGGGGISEHTYPAGVSVWAGVAVPAAPGGDSGLLCDSHVWPYYSALARLRVLQVLPPYQPAFLFSSHLSTYLTYIHASWRSHLVNTSGSSAGGHALVLHGERLCYGKTINSVHEAGGVNASEREKDACSTQSFSCRWEEILGEHGGEGSTGGGSEPGGRFVEALAELLNTSTLQCTTPVWPYPAARTRLTIVDRSNATILGYVPSHTEEAVYQFLPDVRNMSTAEGGSPPQISAAGNAEIAISGAGLDPQQSYTAFLLADSYNRAHRALRLQAYACESVSTVLIRCTFPPPPHDLEAQAVQVRVFESVGGGPEVGAEVSCCGAPGCVCWHQEPVIYSEAWTGASTSSVHANGCTDFEYPCTETHQFLYIDGAGFSTSASYACSFTAASGGGFNRITAAHVPLSPSRVACHLPGNAGVDGFGSFRGALMLSLLRSGDGEGSSPKEVRLYHSRYLSNAFSVCQHL